jgi:hypothetical protein
MKPLSYLLDPAATPVVGRKVFPVVLFSNTFCLCYATVRDGFVHTCKQGSPSEAEERERERERVTKDSGRVEVKTKHLGKTRGLYIWEGGEKASC